PHGKVRDHSVRQDAELRSRQLRDRQGPRRPLSRGGRAGEGHSHEPRGTDHRAPQGSLRQEVSAIMRFGLSGLGNMGGGMARNIRAAGFDLMVYDVREEAMAALERAGASR